VVARVLGSGRRRLRRARSQYRLKGATDTDLWGVGSFGYVAHFDGATWTASRLPGDADYTSLAITGTGEGWAVGAAARARLHGGQWQETYDVITRQWLWSASGSSATNLWALGSMGDIVRRTASGWDRVASPFSLDNDHNYAVLANNDHDVWIGGAYRSAHWNGTAFTMFEDLDDVRAFWAASGADAWAVGEYGRLSHFNGTFWTDVSNPAAGTDLFGVAGTTSSDVWAIGHGLLLHYDGHDWTKVDAGIGPYEDWSTIVAIAPDDVWIAGESQNLRHFDGTTWTAFPATTETRPWFRSGYAAAPDDVWFVLARSELVHWNGSTFDHEPLVGAAELVGFGSQQWVTGENGEIRRRQL
jgi:hypothetical protein